LADGVVIAVVGASGAGKDTLVKRAAERLAGRDDVCFVRGVITRHSDCVTKDHHTLTEAEFERERMARSA
jgi:ribose 1,5-bisphosphokinase